MQAPLLVTSYNLLHDRTCGEEFREHDLLACIAGGVDGVGGHSGLAHAAQECGDFGRFAGPVCLDAGDVQAVHRVLEIFAVEDCCFVCLAGEAPVGGRVNEYGTARLREFFDEFRRVAIPAIFGDELY